MIIALALWFPGFALSLWLLRGDWRLPWSMRLGVAAVWFVAVPWALLKRRKKQ